MQMHQFRVAVHKNLIYIQVSQILQIWDMSEIAKVYLMDTCGPQG
jgi:hypothetical protein